MSTIPPYSTKVEKTSLSILERNREDKVTLGKYVTREESLCSHFYQNLEGALFILYELVVIR